MNWLETKKSRLWTNENQNYRIKNFILAIFLFVSLGSRRRFQCVYFFLFFFWQLWNDSSLGIDICFNSKKHAHQQINLPNSNIPWHIHTRIRISHTRTHTHSHTHWIVVCGSGRATVRHTCTHAHTCNRVCTHYSFIHMDTPYTRQTYTHRQTSFSIVRNVPFDFVSQSKSMNVLLLLLLLLPSNKSFTMLATHICTLLFPQHLPK